VRAAWDLQGVEKRENGRDLLESVYRSDARVKKKKK
jgi:hypothetical protein